MHFEPQPQSQKCVFGIRVHNVFQKYFSLENILKNIYIYFFYLLYQHIKIIIKILI